MKSAIIAILFSGLFMSNTRAQGLAYTIPLAQPEPAAYSPAAFQHSQQKMRMCVAAKVGLVVVGAGLVTGIAGIGTLLSGFGSLQGNNDAQINTGALLFVAGGCMELIGGGLAIGGGIHDHFPGRRLSVVAPKPNEVGIAYTFR